MGGSYTLMVHSEDVAPLVSYDFENCGECAGLVLQLQFELAYTSVLGKATVDYAVQDVHVDVSSRHQAHYFLSFQRKFTEH